MTGGYDQVIRIWDISGEEPHGDVSTTTVKPVISSHLKIDKTKVLMEYGSLMKVESPAHIDTISMELSSQHFM